MSNISQYTPEWLSDTAANKYVKTYFNSFVDISGGDLVVRGTGKIYNDDLANKFIDNFKQFESNTNIDIIEAGPKLD
jgi:hypothetical protein